MSGTIPTQSSKASTAANDMEITNCNELVELNVKESLEDQADPSKLKEKKLTSDVWKEMSRLTDPDRSIKAQEYDDDDIVERKKIEKCQMGMGIPRPTLDRGGSGLCLEILYPGGYGSGSRSKFHYKGTGLGLGVP
ncbi:hypothetical protein M9H77_30052 [Catharanthus roseus]|uniref:Uncharacterized protein n=1 Tax=Catharanthus roseus TaxID=4058 RepID=A0ACB9ZY13_CATRO|nr:hypothetical protein M9H77_30052 [Catharanthus roseus]